MTSHKWKDVYYGVECEVCGIFYVDGCAPWEYDEEEIRRSEAEEYYAMHWTCEACGGEFWDGGMSCACGIEDDEDE
jgi:hypothetical protein